MIAKLEWTQSNVQQNIGQLQTPTMGVTINKKSLIYLLGGEIANHVNFMQNMLVLHSSCYFSSLEGNIAEVSKIIHSGNYFELVFMQY